MPKRHLPGIRGDWAAATVFILLFSLGMVVASVAQEVPDVANTDAVVFISVRQNSSNTDRTQGSGIILGPQGFILTASHVIADYDPQVEKILVRIKSINAPSVPAEIVRCGTGAIDICIVKILDSDVSSSGVSQFYRLSCSYPRRNEHIRAVGFPPAGSVAQIPGIITGDISLGLSFPTNAGVVQGMSGGPVFDANHRVFAIIRGALNQAGVMTFIQSLSLAKDLVGLSPNKCEDSASGADGTASTVRVSGDTGFATLPEQTRTPLPDVANKVSELTKRPPLQIVGGSLIIPKGDDTAYLTASSLSLRGGNIVTNGRNLVIEVINLAMEGGSLFSFRRAAPDGDSGGQVSILVHGQITGNMRVDLSGQPGTSGRDGAPGRPGPAGREGDNAASGLLDCQRGAGPGGSGGAGGKGEDGTAGGPGGNGGTLLIQLAVANVSAISKTIDFTARGGTGGSGGVGGSGGTGGPGGAGGSPRGLCQGSGPRGAAGPLGPSGLNGPPGTNGADGKMLFLTIDAVLNRQ
jgi:hypothetical protein